LEIFDNVSIRFVPALELNTDVVQCALEQERGIYAASPGAVQHACKCSRVFEIPALKRPEGRAPERIVHGEAMVQGKTSLDVRRSMFDVPGPQGS